MLQKKIGKGLVSNTKTHFTKDMFVLSMSIEYVDKNMHKNQRP